MNRPIYTMDFETDPFAYKKDPKAFAVGLYDGQNFDSIWSLDCARKMVERLKRLPPGVIYMHNGGRFDIFYLFPWLESDMRLIGGRIVEARIGEHLIRDSYAIIPAPLAAYKKDDIDIKLLDRKTREANRDEILSYLRGDCVYLYELVTSFIAEFGEHLTIGSAAMNQLRKFHPFENTGSYLDEKFRRHFFFGGRVQCFKSGIINQPFNIYDVNSMYPYVMKNFLHPIGGKFEVDREVKKKTQFVVVEGKQLGKFGAFPLRGRDGGISFNVEQGTFSVTIHEFNAALETGYFKPGKIIKTYGFESTTCFAEFVDHFYNARVLATKNGDELHRLFYKLILNSAYGKFAQNPDNYCDFAITHRERLPAPWTEKFIHQQGKFVIWKKPVSRHAYFNVAVGASITGAARSVLMVAIRNSVDPLYCDTDSIITRELNNSNFDESTIGAWKTEGSGDRIAIAGKKLYACFSGEECIKQATKGARISADEIVRVAQGETVVFRNQAPTFKLDGRIQYIKRKIKRTV